MRLLIDEKINSQRADKTELDFFVQLNISMYKAKRIEQCQTKVAESGDISTILVWRSFLISRISLCFLMLLLADPFVPKKRKLAFPIVNKRVSSLITEVVRQFIMKG